MCVFVEIEIPGHPRSEAGRLSREALSRGLLAISAQRQVKSAAGSRFLLGPSDHPCACSLGGDRVDESGRELRFDQSHLEKIEATLRFLMSEAGVSGLRIRSYYAGGTHDPVPPLTDAEATLDDLLARFRKDRVGGNVRYNIRGRAA